jgi:dTDP-4-amino-4,6-dideoxygalactose transaminase
MNQDFSTAPWPYFSADEIKAVTQVLQSGKVNYWTGEEGRNFECEFAGHVRSKYAVALHNGTVALELALYALNIGVGDEVIVTPRTFIATASAIVLRGATPIFADIDANSQNITAESISAVITPRTRAIILVHLAGWPCEMESILALARNHDIKVIEDCAQAHGAHYNGQHVGTLGDVGAFSFCQDKILTTGGEGGMLVTDDKEVWERAWAYKDHGKSYNAVYHRQHPLGFRWFHEDFGTNWRMLEVQAAIGRVILPKLTDWVETRRRNAAWLNEGLAGVGALRLTIPPPHLYHAYYKYYAFLNPKRLRSNWSRDRVMQEINDLGIPCSTGSCSEIYLEKAFVKHSLQPTKRLPVAKELGETSLTFLVHPTLTESHILATIDGVREVVSRATL